MKYRYFLLAIYATIGAICLAFKFPELKSVYEFNSRYEYEQSTLDTLQLELQSVRAEVSNNLKFAYTLDDIVSVIAEIPDVRLNRVQSYMQGEGNSIVIGADITTTDNDLQCDGFVFTLNTTEPSTLVEALADREINIHSLDVLLTSNTVILRVRNWR